MLLTRFRAAFLLAACATAAAILCPYVVGMPGPNAGLVAPSITATPRSGTGSRTPTGPVPIHQMPGLGT